MTILKRHLDHAVNLVPDPPNLSWQCRRELHIIALFFLFIFCCSSRCKQRPDDGPPISEERAASDGRIRLGILKNFRVAPEIPDYSKDRAMSRNNRRNRHRAEAYTSPEPDNVDPAYQSVSYPLTEYPEYIMSTDNTMQPSDLSAPMGSSQYPDAGLEQGIHSLTFAEEAPFTEYSAQYAGEASTR